MFPFQFNARNFLSVFLKMEFCSRKNIIFTHFFVFRKTDAVITKDGQVESTDISNCCDNE
jgi:hypothetical protein